MTKSTKFYIRFWCHGMYNKYSVILLLNFPHCSISEVVSTIYICSLEKRKAYSVFSICSKSLILFDVKIGHPAKDGFCISAEYSTSDFSVCDSPESVLTFSSDSICRNILKLFFRKIYKEVFSTGISQRDIFFNACFTE